MSVTRDPTRVRRLSGVGPTVPTRVCDTCRYELPIRGYFVKESSTTCTVCTDEAWQARAWTIAHLDALLVAARGVLDLWPRYMERFTDEELDRWRALLAATGRTPLNDGEDGDAP